MTQVELSQRLSRQLDELLSITSALSDEQIGKMQVTGQWTTKDIVGHISYWEQINLDHIRQAFTEGKPRPMSLQDPEETINARQVKKRKGWKWTRVRAEFENTRGASIARASSLSEMELAFIVPSPWWSDQAKFYSVG